MFDNLKQAADYVRKNNIRTVDLKFTDLAGRWHHITLPASQFNERLLRDGVGFDASSIGLRPVKAGDMVVKPDLASAFRDPFWELPTLSFICSAYEADTKNPFPRDPRNIAICAEEFLRKTGIADQSRWGPEYEFYIFDSISFENTTSAASYKIESSEAEGQSARGNHGYVIPKKGGYAAVPPRDHLFNLRNEITAILEEMGVPVKYHHHEVGGQGQCEIETPMASMLRACDATQIIKYVTKMVAVRHNKTVTFMPKPLFGEAGSGMHFHQHLFKKGKNLFYDPKGYGKLSQLALWYIGGLLQHSPALLALTNPSTNSYCRLVPGYEAPTNAFFSLANRSAAIRVPKYADDPETTRIEFRPPDATCNIYLALAAQLLAGIDGIRKKIDPTKQGFGPFEQDVFSCKDDKLRKSLKPLPASLAEAMDALEKDNRFLLEGGVFDEGQLADWIKLKREEHHNILTRPHPFEMTLYFDA